mmetsp:Transcript_32144/g.77719  ORF Transcript_32144/g.77719 Transcript_32144/m.77719 type:complete len:207 (-) Transcript_32144:1368-1988(-)
MRPEPRSTTTADPSVFAPNSFPSFVSLPSAASELMFGPICGSPKPQLLPFVFSFALSFPLSDASDSWHFRREISTRDRSHFFRRRSICPPPPSPLVHPPLQRKTSSSSSSVSYPRTKDTDHGHFRSRAPPPPWRKPPSPRGFLQDRPPPLYLLHRVRRPSSSIAILRFSPPRNADALFRIMTIPLPRIRSVVKFAAWRSKVGGNDF